MGPISHFLVGMLCGAAIGAVVLAFRRRWAVYLPAFVLACGFWGEAPWLLGVPGTSAGLANVCFGYAWLHPWIQGREDVAFFFVLVIANVLLLGPLGFLTWTVWTVDTVRWEREGGKQPKEAAAGRHIGPRRRQVNDE